jgi:3-oxoacyl-[acyl-carrier-protein] synthase II
MIALMRRRVVVTGIGMVTPLGNSVEESWAGMCSGRSGVARITRFDASTLPTKIAAEVKRLDLAKLVDHAERYEFSGHNTRFAVAAAQMAWRDSGIDPARIDPARLGVYLGAGEGQHDFERFMVTLGPTYQEGRVNTQEFNRSGMQRLHREREWEQEPNMPAGHVAALVGAQGPNYNCLTACAASSQAIGEALELIRRGDADLMVSGGAHTMIHPFGVVGFNLLTALSTRNDEPERASRPFDRDRDGFILGEGAGMVVLEELEHAKARGAKFYGELIGYGSTADAYRMTDPHPGGRGAIRAIRDALADAEIAPTDIQYVNAHGTSTGGGDAAETVSMKVAFGDHAYKVPISSIKSMTGHLIAAAGAVELITCLLTIRDGVIPPTINYEHPDPQCDLDYVPNTAREARVDVALSNSFGFGGQNVCLVARRFAG